MTQSIICTAPKGKFRVVEIDEAEQEVSTVETDYTEVIMDCDSIIEAEGVMREAEGLAVQRLIYNDRAECLEDFRPFTWIPNVSPTI